MTVEKAIDWIFIGLFIMFGSAVFFPIMSIILRVSWKVLTGEIPI